MHAEGKSYRHIAEQLNSQGLKINKDIVNKIVTRLVEIMKTSPCSDNVNEEESIHFTPSDS